MKYKSLIAPPKEVETLSLTAYIACSRRRPPLILPFLKGHPHHLYYGPDDTFPPKDFRLPPHWSQLQPFLVGQFRAWNNQVEMAKLFLDTAEPIGMFMEDDAVPIVSDWPNICNWAARTQMKDFDVFDLYANPMHCDGTANPYRYIRSRVTPRLFRVTVDPIKGRPLQVWGCQAFLITRRVAEALVRRDYDGTPIDSWFPNFGTFAFLDPSPFEHDRSQGSMIEKRLLSEAEEKLKLTKKANSGILIV